MANQGGSQGGNSGSNASAVAQQAAAISAQAQAQMQQASKLADELMEKALSGTKEQANIASKMVQQQNKIIEQQKEIQKNAEALIKSEQKRQKVLDEIKKVRDEMAKLDGKAKEDKKVELDQLEKEQKILRDQVVIRKAATLELQKAADTQKKALDDMTKQQGVLGSVFAAAKSQMGQYLIGVGTMANALVQLGKMSQNVLDVAILSGNYAELNKSMTSLALDAAKFQYGISQANVGLRFLGYSSEEVAASFKDLTGTVKNFDNSIGKINEVEVMTEATGRLARVLGVSLPEATQYAVEMNKKFNSSNGQTAGGLYTIYENTKKYNGEAGTMVIRARDVTKVMFDLAQESQAAAFEQEYFGKTLTNNMLQLQAQGKNYKEALDGASLYLRKLSTEAPDWSKIFAGRELSQQLTKDMAAGGGQLSKEMQDRLESARPGLAKRVTEILRDTKDEFTKQKLLQEVLSGTQVGFEAMDKVVSKLITNMGDKASLALQKMYGINASQADTLIRQVKLNQELLAKKQQILAIDKLSSGEQAQRIKDFAAQNNISEKYAEQIIRGHKEEAVMSVLQATKSKEATAEIKRQNEEQQAAFEAKKKALQEQINNTDDADTKKSLQDQLDKMKGPEAVNAKVGGDTAAAQGGWWGEKFSQFTEFMKNPMTQFVIAAAILGKQLVVQTLILARMGGLKGMLDVVKGTLGKGGGLAGNIAKGAGGLLSKGAGLAKNGLANAGVLGEASMGEIGAMGAGSIAASAAAVAAAGAAGAAVGMGINKLDDWIGKKLGKDQGYMADAIQKGMSKASGLVGGATISSDADMAKATSPEAIEAQRQKMKARWDAMKASGLNSTPASALPAGSGASGGPQPTGGASSGSGTGASNQQGTSNRVQFEAKPIPGAQGVDVEFMGRIPFAQLMAMNMDIMKRGVGSPSGR